MIDIPVQASGNEIVIPEFPEVLHDFLYSLPEERSRSCINIQITLMEIAQQSGVEADKHAKILAELRNFLYSLPEERRAPCIDILKKLMRIARQTKAAIEALTLAITHGKENEQARAVPKQIRAKKARFALMQLLADAVPREKVTEDDIRKMVVPKL